MFLSLLSSFRFRQGVLRLVAFLLLNCFRLLDVRILRRDGVVFLFLLTLSILLSPHAVFIRFLWPQLNLFEPFHLQFIFHWNCSRALHHFDGLQLKNSQTHPQHSSVSLDPQLITFVKKISWKWYFVLIFESILRVFQCLIRCYFRDNYEPTALQIYKNHRYL